jgi:hypothetical protein
VILQEQWGQEHKSNGDGSFCQEQCKSNGDGRAMGTARAMGTVLFADKILYHHCELDVLANMRIRL